MTRRTLLLYDGDMHDIQPCLATIRQELPASADPAHAKGRRAFFKKPVTPLDVRLREFNALAPHRWRKLKRLDPAQVLDLCSALWRSDVFKEQVLANKWSARAASAYIIESFNQADQPHFCYSQPMDNAQ